MLTITQNFSMPIASVRLNNVEKLNSDLLIYFHSLVDTEGARNDLPTQPERLNLYESKYDLFDHDNAAVLTVKEFMHKGLKELIMNLNDYPTSIRETLNIEQHAWFHITHEHGYYTSHNHPMASWSAIYCVASGGPKNHPESSVTRFFHPNPTANCYIDAGNASLKSPFTIAPLNFSLEAGDLVFFPSHLMHEVSAHQGTEERVTIAVNFWINSDLVKVRI